MRETLILRGQTGNIGFMFIQDSSSTTGAGLTGVTSASGSLNISVRREKSSAMTTYTGANIGAISTLGTWANPGTGKVNIKAVDATNAPGLYELHFEDAIFNSGDTSRKLVGYISGVTNMAPTPFEVPLAAVDAQDATAFGVSRIDAAVSSRSTLTQVQVSGYAGPILTDNATGAVTVGSLTTAAVALIWNALTSGMTTAGSIAKRIIDNLTGDAFARIGLNGAGLTAVGLAGAYDAAKTAAQAGDQMSLTSATLTAIAAAVEGHLIDEADGQQLLTAIVAKINSTDVNLAGLSTATIAAAVWAYLLSNMTTPNSGGSAINTMLAQVNKIGTNSGDSPNAATAQGTISIKLDAPVSNALAAATSAATQAGNAASLAGSIQATTSKFFFDASNFVKAAAQTLPNPAPTGYGGGGSGGPVGPGADTVTLTFSDQSGPIADAKAWVTADVGGSQVVAGSLQTNTLGQVTFLLTDGLPYYAWLQKDGVNSIIADLFTAERD